MSQRKKDAKTSRKLTVAVSGDSFRVHVTECGSSQGMPLLLLHGWGSSSSLMNPLADALAAHFRIIMIDFPGHGESPVPPIPMDVPMQAELVRRVIEEIIAPNAFGIVGHSNGGRVALHLAASAGCPDSLRFLALVSPSGVRRRRTVGYYVRSGLARALKWPFRFLPGKLRDYGLDWLRHSLLWRVLGSSDYRALSGTMRETFVLTVNHYLEDQLPRVSIPVLLFRATDDAEVSGEQMETMHRLLPDAGFHEMSDGGHFGYVRHASVIAEGVQTLAGTPSEEESA